MRLPHNALVAVADGRKLLFLRNEGDAVQPVLRTVKVEVKPNPKDGDQKTDVSGQAPSDPSLSGTMGEVDFHQLEEDRFAAETADLLKRRAMNGAFESLSGGAPPHPRGARRKHYHTAGRARLAAELAKDLTNHPLDAIERILIAAD